jgi:hypothetical protein
MRLTSQFRAAGRTGIADVCLDFSHEKLCHRGTECAENIFAFPFASLRLCGEKALSL